MNPWRRLYFNLIAPVYSLARRPGVDELAMVLRLLTPTPGAVLDLGAGAGHHARHLLQRCPGLSVTAVEPARLFRAVSRWLASAAGLNGRLVQQGGTAERLPFPDGSFDGALCLFVLWAVEDRRRAVDELARVLRPGGTLVVGEFAQPPAGRRLRLPFGHAPLSGQEDLAALLEPYFVVEAAVMRPYAVFGRCRKISPDPPSTD